MSESAKLSAAMDCVIVESDKGGVSADGLAFRLGISRSRASSLLSSLPARLVVANRDGRRVFYRRRFDPSASEIELARQRLRRASSASMKRKRTELADRAESILSDAASALAEGNFDELRDLLASPLLDPPSLRRMLPPGRRDALAVVALVFRADLAMQRGHLREAVVACERALKLPTSGRFVPKLLGILGAALRMCSDRASMKRSLDAYASGIESALGTVGLARSEALSNLHAAAVAPSLVLGRLEEARHHAEMAAKNAVLASCDRRVESWLRLAQVEHATGNQSLAIRFHDMASSCEPRSPWLSVWLHRLHPVFFGNEFSSEEWNVATRRAFESASSFGFQKLLVVGQMVLHSDRFVDDMWTYAKKGNLSRFVSRLHVERHGRGISSCSFCRKSNLPGVLAHSIGCAPGSLPRYLTT